MIRRARTWRAVAVLGIAGLTLAACGDDDADATDDDAATDETMADETMAEESGEAAGSGGGDGVLTLGTLLPQTGDLAFLGPPEFAGVDLAVQEINAEGGVLGEEVVKIDTDSGDTTTDIASQSVSQLLGQDVDAIIGAAASGVSLTVIDQITGAGVIQFSPANTSPTFTDYDDDGLYFRTAPSDALQGRIIGNLLVEDGFLDVAIINRDDDYGNGLAAATAAQLESGGGTVVGGGPIVYDPTASSFSAEVTQIVEAQPEAVVLIGFDESVRIIQELIAQNAGPQALPLYLVDGNLADYSEDFEAGALAGVKGTAPGAEGENTEFQERLLEVDSTLTDFTYGPESYDATIIIALATVAAGTDGGEAIAAEINNVTRDGEACTTFADCVALLEAGEDIDYDGATGPLDFSDAGEPASATISINEYDETNSFTPVDFVTADV